MKWFRFILVSALVGGDLLAAPLPEEFVAASEKRRAEIPLGGDLKPGPAAPVFVAVGHGARILPSRDDGGKNWDEVYAFEPETGHVHGAQVLRAVAFGYVTAKPVER